MKTDNKEELSDKTLVIKSDNINNLCSSFTSSVASIDFGSINIASTFQPLTQNGIATGLIDGIATSLKTLETQAVSIASTLSALVQEQQDIDQKGAKDAKNKTPYINNNNRNNNNKNNNTDYKDTDKNKVDDQKKSDDKDIKDDDDDSVIPGAKKLDEVKDALDKEIQKLDDYDQIELIKDLMDISDNNLKDLLYNENYSKVLKEQLLKNVHLSDDLKKIIADMDENEVQKYLKNLLVNGETITDFSKLVITAFEDTTKSKDGSTSSKIAQKVLDSFSNISDDDIQKSLSDLYSGNVGSEVDDDVIYFTRNFVDIISSVSDTTSEDILSDSKYKDTLLTCTKDITKTFSYMNASTSIGNDASKTFFSNIILKES